MDRLLRTLLYSYLLCTRWTAVVTALAQFDSVEADHAGNAVITRDVCVIGGGSSGTYAALRLRDMGQSVVVVEREDRLGGHTFTYTDPATGNRNDLGVIVWHDLDIVKSYLARYDIPLKKAVFDFSTAVIYADFRTGEVVSNFTPPDPTDALARYGVELAKYPYLEAGFYLPDPIPSDLLLPFGEFAEKYGLADAVPTIFNFGQGIGDLLRLPTLYVMKLVGIDVLRNIQIGFLTTVRADNSELYRKALAELGADVLLSSRITAVKRSGRAGRGGARIRVETPSGPKLIRAKKIVLAIPPKLEQLQGIFDLDKTERSVFGQFRNAAYYTGLLRDTGIPDSTTQVTNVMQNSSYNLPALPGSYGFGRTAIPGLYDVKYGSPTPQPEEEVKADVLAELKRLRAAGALSSTNGTAADPEFVVFKAHVPFELTVPVEAIRAGFYRDLYALQGRNGMYYTGAAFHTHDSSLLWNFTEALLPRIIS